MKQKPVWRQWNGKSHVVNATHLLHKGHSRVSFNESRDIALGWLEGDETIVAYATGEFRSAKYERIDCGKSDGTESWDKVIGGTNCINCNGKGYRLEAINHAN